MAAPAGPKADRRTRDRQRRWLAAGLVSLGVHAVVVLGLALTTPKGGPRPEPPVFEVTLERLVPPPPPPVQPARNQAQQPTSPIRPHQPPTIIPGAPVSGLDAGAGAQPAAPPGPTASAPPAPANPKLQLDCLHLGPRAKTGVYGREDCEVQKFAKRPGSSDQVFATRANPVWDAQVASQMRKHEPLPRGQEPRMDCPGANLGLGCRDEVKSYSTEKKF